MDTRFEEMSHNLWTILDIYKPNIVYVEETVVLRNAQTQRFLTRLQGIIYAWCMNHGCEFNTIRPTSWRKQLSFSQGKNVKRNQLKEQSIKYVLDNYGLNVCDDEADAICIGDAVLKMFGSQDKNKYQN
ncbi:MAG: crossover junction endodeoxyribonuclease RuvC [Lachnospiraceae bacterium]|nr:crossover junction endodeoxyribonuclease RuvC [Lachnospiraceae bacterium]